MIINVDPAGTAAGLGQTLHLTQNIKGVQSLLVLACDANGFAPADTDPILTRLKLPVFGGIFPSILHDGDKLDRGTLVIGFRTNSRVLTIDGLGDENADYIAQLDTRLGGLEDIATVISFVDGFSRRINAFINSLFTVFGLRCNYLGGGAGSLRMTQQPCLFTNDGLVQDKAVIALLDAPSGVGVCHGWQSVSGPFRVTESEYNLIRTLDWKPAFEVYREAIHHHSQLNITRDNFFEIAKSYPFGITRLEQERIVRDPVKILEDGAIMCVGEVPEGSFVDVLNGDIQSLLAAAGRAGHLGVESYRGSAATSCRMVIDCISRVLFLGDRFQEEINAVRDPGQPLFGACTIGEIANCGSDFLEFYNKTAVVGILEAQ